MTDTTQTMVERVMSALSTTEVIGAYGPETLRSYFDSNTGPTDDEFRSSVAAIARAAIAAMAEPTQDMENAADDLDQSGAPYCPGSPAEVYRVMMQAALLEKTEGDEP